MKIIYMQRTFPLLSSEVWDVIERDQNKEVKTLNEEQYIVLKINEE